MLEMKIIQKLIGITLFIDILLIYCLLQFKLNSYDYYFIIITLVLHSLFIYFLINYDKDVIYLLHISIFVLIGLGIFIKNKYLLMIPFILLVIIQILWQLEKKCILNEEDQEFGYDNTIVLTTLGTGYYYMWRLSKLF
tara:strand:+ start:302 stop:715 length:414 start_codon:yes stop_codon:yes gene_type:complete